MILTYIIWPLEFDWQLFITAIIGVDGLNYRNGGQILNEHDWASRSQVSRVVDDGRE